MSHSSPWYGLNWPGRAEAFHQAVAEPKTLVRDAASGENLWETPKQTLDISQNLFIEGDNLEALKHLLATHAGQVKLIYIDPPYNTGNAFVYNDSFTTRTNPTPAGNVSEQCNDSQTEPVVPLSVLQKQLEALLQAEDPGQSGMRHGGWLNMMAPRLLLAQQMLRPDGIILISIDVGEVAYLTALMDQIFGPENSLGTMVWASNMKGRQIGAAGPRRTHEYVVAYGRCSAKIQPFAASAKRLTDLMPTVYRKVTYPIRHDQHGPYVTKNQLYNTNSKFNEQTAKSMVYAIDYNPKSGAVSTRDINMKTGRPIGKKPGRQWITIMPHPNHRAGVRFHAWRWSRTRVETTPQELDFRQSRGEWRVYTKIREIDRIAVKDLIVGPSTITGMRDLERHGLGKFFSYPKPVALIELLIEAATGPNDIVLDFFAGSGTTAEAVVGANAIDDGHRRCVLVQLDEPLERGGYRTLADVTRARMDAVGIQYRDLRLVERQKG